MECYFRIKCQLIGVSFYKPVFIKKIVMAKHTELYDLLGVEPTATEDEIRVG